MTDLKRTKRPRGATVFAADRKTQMLALKLTSDQMRALDVVADRFGVSRATIARKLILGFLASSERVEG